MCVYLGPAFLWKNFVEIHCTDWKIIHLFFNQIYRVEALVMKLVISLDFNPDLVANMGW